MRSPAASTGRSITARLGRRSLPNRVAGGEPEAMRAVQYREIGRGPEVVDIPTPSPRPGEVLLQVTAAGLCHSDWFLMDLPADRYSYGLPLTLGHEGVGRIAALGMGVTSVRVGDAVAVYGPWGCGRCAACASGAENFCARAGEMGIRPPGLGAPGALAEYLIVDDPRHLVALGDLDPVQAVSLTDAGLTPYHAVMASREKMRPAALVAVIGAGGLGHVAVQIIRAVTAATVVALDVDQEKLRLATEVGAQHVAPSGAEAPSFLRELSGGVGAAVVLDFVGSPATLELGRRMVAVDGDIQIVGIGGGLLPTGFFSTPYGVRVSAPYWGSRTELMEVLDLARAGLVRVHVERYGLDEAPEAYRRLHEGRVRGRAVVVP
jgi:alcohol dehydrogenase, propanol-preferring